MILEGLITTTNPDGTPHLAPMGPRVEPDMQRFLLRPFPTSHTYQNMLKHGAVNNRIVSRPGLPQMGH